MKKMLIILLITHMGISMRAQQNLGIRNSNYAGIQGALLNPSSIADSKLKWDINIISVDEVFDNTFLFAPKNSLSFLGFKKIIKGAIKEDLFATHFDSQNPNKLYNVTFSGEALGPSFFIKLPKKQAIGFSASARVYANINNITGTLSQNLFDYFLNKSLWGTELHDNSAKINEMSWMQYGVHYAAVLYSNGKDELTAGISLNYLLGNTAAFVKNMHINYQITDTSNFILNNSSIDYGRTDINKSGDFNNGHGFGADIGFTYLHYNYDSKNYLYRIGFSLIDLGAINFKNNAAAYHLQADSVNLSNWHQLKFSNNVEFDRTISAFFYNGDSAKSLTANHFKMGLPAAISIQVDWNICKNYFINTTIIKGFGHADGQGVVRPDVYSITPRYETKITEVSVPLSLLYYGHLQPRMGVAVRYRYFFIGGDAPGSLLKLSNLEGVDFYAGIRFSVFNKNDK
ncbi:MAG TPA: DUF5723 family protein [Puia sp.]|jgi:hypothetical protein|nr:DUF5723 family protein [Puia sp.]